MCVKEISSTVKHDIANMLSFLDHFRQSRINVSKIVKYSAFNYSANSVDDWFTESPKSFWPSIIFWHSDT